MSLATSNRMEQQATHEALCIPMPDLHYYFKDSLLSDLFFPCFMNEMVVEVMNEIGGAGKTTTCANLGIGLAREDKKVLLIDTDPQGACLSLWVTHSPTISPLHSLPSWAR